MPGMTAAANSAVSSAVADVRYAPSRVKPIISAVLVTVFLFAVFIGGTHPGISETGIRMFSGAIALVVLAGWIVVAAVRPAWRPQSPLLLPIAVALLLFCVAALFSQDQRLSEDAILQAGALVLAFLLMTRLADDPFYRVRLMWLVVAVVVVIAAAYAVHVLISWAVWWSVVGRIAVPPLRPLPSDVADLTPVLTNVLTRLNLGAVNLTAGVLVLAMPFAVAVVATRSRAAAIGLTVLGLFVLVTSASRGAILGVGFAVVAALGLVLLGLARDPGSRLSPRGIVNRPDRLAVALAASAAVVGFLVLLAPTVINRFAVGVEAARVSLYEATIRLIEAHPILGTGPGTWSLLHSAVTPDGQRNIVQNHAHDTYLQTLSDVGILGGLACLAVAIVVVVQLVRRFRAAAGADRLIVGGVIVGLAGAGGSAIFDHFLNLAGYCLILLAVVAIGLVAPPPPVDAEGTGQVNSRGTGRGGLALLLAAMVVVVLAMPTILAHARAELSAADARAAGNRGDWAAAAKAARDAAALDPGLPLYRIELGLALAHLGDPSARELVAQAAGDDPLPHLQLSAAALALAAGDRAAALGAVQQAEARATGEVVIDLNAGEVARIAGRPDLAVAWWTKAIAEDPGLAGSDFFRDRARADLGAQAVGAAEDGFAQSGNGAARALLVAIAGSPDAAESALRAMPASTSRDVALGQVLWQMGRQAETIDLLEVAADRDPTNPAAPRALVNYCVETGDQACADRYRKWTLLTTSELNDTAPNDGATIPAPDDQRYRGTPAGYPASVYLQSGFDDMLAPGVLVVGLP